MASLVGHVLPGFGFFVIGLWHLLNHIKVHTLNPKSYKALPWFPTSKSRYLELFLIMGGSLASISMELFIGPESHPPLDPDGTIPSNHLHNFEHSLISATLFLYAASAIILDKISPKATQYGLTLLLGAIAFGQELLLFHFHSTDDHGIEGQYHLLLQVVIFISLITTLLGINYPDSFMISFVRSLSILFQGVWLAVMGVMLWIPDFVPKGCFLNFDQEGHRTVRCHGDEALNRAKSLVNIEFGGYVILLSVFAVFFYLFLVKIYGNKVEYHSISKCHEKQEEEEEVDDDDDDVEAQKKSKEVCFHGKVLSCNGA